MDFKKFTITTEENAKDAVNAFNALKSEEKAKALPTLKKAFAEFNEENRAKVLDTYAAFDGAEMWKKWLDVSVSIDDKTPSKIAKAVNSAVCFWEYELDDSQNKIELFKKAKSVKFADLTKRKVEYEASKYADKKITDSDKEKIFNELFPADILGAFCLLSHSVCDARKLRDDAIYMTAEAYNTALVTADKHFETLKKQNPFRATSKTAEKEQVQYFFSFLIGEELAKRFNNYHYNYLKNSLATVQNNGIYTTAGLDKISHFVTFCARCALNGLPLPEKDNSPAHTQTKKTKVQSKIKIC
jgi:PIN domain nuclease of toxin-antitoxin system